MRVARKTGSGTGVFLRCGASDIARLDALVAHIPITTRGALALALMRIGLDLVEADPTRLFSGAPPRSSAAPGDFPTDTSPASKRSPASNKGGPAPGRKGG